MCLVCGLSQGGSVREHGDEPPDLGWLKLGRMKDGTRSAVAVRTFAEKGSGPLAEVEDMVAKTHMDGPFRKFRGRPQGKVAISSCGRPWNSYDIARRLYRILRIATLLFILLPEFFSKLGIQSEEILDGRTDILLPQTTGTDSNPRGPCHLGKGRHRESTMEGTAVAESKRQNAPVFHPV